VGRRPCSGVNIRYHGNYSVQYNFDPRRNTYNRFMNGVKHLDHRSLKPIAPGTLIVQESAMRIVDKKGRQEISFIGKGRAWVLIGGSIIVGTWSKVAPREFTRIFDKDGKAIVFDTKNPIWFQVVSPQLKVTFNNAPGREGPEPNNMITKSPKMDGKKP